MQVQRDRPGIQYKGVLDALVKIYKQEGLQQVGVNIFAALSFSARRVHPRGMELPPALARQCSRPLPAGWPTGLLPSPLGVLLGLRLATVHTGHGEAAARGAACVCCWLDARFSR